MTVDFNAVCLTATKRLNRNFSRHPDVHDAIQEAHIRIWKDMDSGIDDYDHLVNRGYMWGKNMLLDAHHYPTGDLGRSREGLTRKTGNATREKIQLYMDEYRNLHGKNPTIKQVQAGTGLKADVARHIQTIKATPVVPLREDGSNRIDRNAYTFVKVPDGSNDEDHGVEPQYIEPAFDTTVDSKLDFAALVGRLEDEELRTVLVLFYEHDWSQKDIAAHLGKKFQADIARLLKKAHKQLKELIGDSSSG